MKSVVSSLICNKTIGCLCWVKNEIYKTNKSVVLVQKNLNCCYSLDFIFLSLFLAVGQMVFGINTYALVLKQNYSVSYSTWLKTVSSIDWGRV